jgi:hypothetical protein
VNDCVISASNIRKMQLCYTNPYIETNEISNLQYSRHEDKIIESILHSSLRDCSCLRIKQVGRSSHASDMCFGCIQFESQLQYYLD